MKSRRDGPNLAFLGAGSVRIMLSTPQGAGTVGHNSILYFRVTDIAATHAAIVGRGAKNEREPQVAARMPDHELWTGFVRDPDGGRFDGGEALRPPNPSREPTAAGPCVCCAAGTLAVPRLSRSAVSGGCGSVWC